MRALGTIILRSRERGSTLLIVAGSLTVLLGISALAIDVGSLYVARSESQRAADAAALAGAKVFVESGCVTSGDCTAEESTASDRATQVALQNLVQGQAVTISAIRFTETAQNPQITVQVQSPALHVYFAGALGIMSAPTLNASATAEAYNPSGEGAGPAFCTGCVRPWLIPNCDPLVTTTPSGCFLAGNGAIQNSGCYPSGVTGLPLQIAIATSPGAFGVVDDGTGLPGYQKSITTCNTGQKTCGSIVNTLVGPNLKSSIVSTTSAGINSLLHTAAGAVGPGQGQDSIDTSVCPPKIHAGANNPLVTQGVIAPDAVIATSDSIVTAYLFNLDANGLDTKNPQPVQVTGFAQIFVTYQDSGGDVWAVILGVAGCQTSDGDCDPGSLKGATLMPIRLISHGGG